MTWTNAVTFFERKLINIFRRLSISVRNKVQILIILYKLILIILYTLILISYYYGMRQYNMCVKVILCYNILYSHHLVCPSTKRNFRHLSVYGFGSRTVSVEKPPVYLWARIYSILMILWKIQARRVSGCIWDIVQWYYIHTETCSVPQVWTMRTLIRWLKDGGYI